jgi:hypothetical protein
MVGYDCYQFPKHVSTTGDQQCGVAAHVELVAKENSLLYHKESSRLLTWVLRKPIGIGLEVSIVGEGGAIFTLRNILDISG